MKWRVALRRMVIRLGFGGLVVGAGLAIAVLTPRQWVIPPSDDCRFPIYVSGDAMHVNLIIPITTDIYDWRNRLHLRELNQPGANYRYLQFGWGDRIFYMETPSWDQVSPASALRALFYWRNTSAMFVLPHTRLPHYPNHDTRCLKLSQADYLALMQFIESSFETDAHQQAIRLGSGQDGNGGFYAAHGYYSALNTCNTWSANGLRAANVNTPLWEAGLATPVLHHLRNGCPCEVVEGEE